MDAVRNFVGENIELLVCYLPLAKANMLITHTTDPNIMWNRQYLRFNLYQNSKFVLLFYKHATVLYDKKYPYTYRPVFERNLCTTTFYKYHPISSPMKIKCILTSPIEQFNCFDSPNSGFQKRIMKYPKYIFCIVCEWPVQSIQLQAL